MHLSQALLVNSFGKLVSKLHEQGELNIVALQPNEDYSYDDDLYSAPPPKVCSHQDVNVACVH